MLSGTSNYRIHQPIYRLALSLVLDEARSWTPWKTTAPKTTGWTLPWCGERWHWMRTMQLTYFTGTCQTPCPSSIGIGSGETTNQYDDNEYNKYNEEMVDVKKWFWRCTGRLEVKGSVCCSLIDFHQYHKVCFRRLALFQVFKFVASRNGMYVISQSFSKRQQWGDERTLARLSSILPNWNGIVDSRHLQLLRSLSMMSNSLIETFGMGSVSCEDETRDLPWTYGTCANK